MRERRLELPYPFECQHLKLVRLPISPLARLGNVEGVDFCAQQGRLSMAPWSEPRKFDLGAEKVRSERSDGWKPALFNGFCSENSVLEPAQTSTLTGFRNRCVILIESSQGCGLGKKKGATVSKTQSQPKPARMSGTMQSQAREIEDLKELAGLLKAETDRWSRQVILAEAAMKLGELEKQLAEFGQGRFSKRAS